MRQVSRLRVRRAELGINQTDTATKSGMGLHRYWKIENGYTQPTDDEQAAIASALESTVPDLFHEPSAAEASR